MKNFKIVFTLFVLFFNTQYLLSQTFLNTTEINAFLADVVIDGKVDYNQIRNRFQEFNRFMEYFKNEDQNALTGDERTAFMINAYNFSVIDQIIENHPIRSVQQVPDFFKKKIRIGGEKVSLNQFEKKLLKDANDARLHFVLICGAKDCPPFPDELFIGKSLESQLDKSTQIALRQSNILKVTPDEKKILASKIFSWYKNDFGDLNDFFKKYNSEIKDDYKVSFQEYNWQLNEVYNSYNGQVDVTNSANDPVELRYFTSNLYDRGEYELNFFNNYYHQNQKLSGIADKRVDNFFTSFLQFTYGWNSRINFGAELKFRSVTAGPSSNIGVFEALNFASEDPHNSGISDITQYKRVGLTQLGLKVKYIPFKTIKGLSFQHNLHIPIISDAEGANGKGFIDWGAPTLYNDIYFDHVLTQKLSLFIQVGLYGENLNETIWGGKSGYYQVSTPVTTIVSYFPTAKSTIYALINSAPQFGVAVQKGDDTDVIPNHYNQYGVGFKYFLTSKVQAEVLVTSFSSVHNDRRAATYNFGVRYFGWK